MTVGNLKPAQNSSIQSQSERIGCKRNVAACCRGRRRVLWPCRQSWRPTLWRGERHRARQGRTEAFPTECNVRMLSLNHRVGEASCIEMQNLRESASYGWVWRGRFTTAITNIVTDAMSCRQTPFHPGTASNRGVRRKSR